MSTYYSRSPGEPYSYPPPCSSDAELPSPHHHPSSSSSENSSLTSFDEDPGHAARVGPSAAAGTYYAQRGSPSPSLPRYASAQSPLNPASPRANAGGNTFGHHSSSSNGNGNGVGSSPGGYSSRNAAAGAIGQPGLAHPLSHTTSFTDSSPTLAESPILSQEKNHFRSSDNNRKVAPSNYRRTTAPTGRLAKLYRVWNGAFIADSGIDERHIKLPRLGYLDGLKFVAAWILLNGTLIDATIPSNQYRALQRNSPLYIFRSTGLGITFLLLLLGRSVATPLWDVPTPGAASAGSNAAPTKTGTALISWARLTRAMLIRPFRFLLPVIAIAALQWGLAASGKLSKANSVGMDEPYWGLISSFSGYATLIFDLFTFYEGDTRAGKTFGANLWTVPWFFQSSYAVYVIHFMLGNLSSNRYWVYAIVATFSWATYNYFFVAILGMVIADLHAHGILHYIRTRWPLALRLFFHLSLLTIALVTQWVPVVRNNINYAFAIMNVQDHPELTFADSIFAFCIVFAVETSGVAQWFFGNVVMRNLGKLSAGMYLLAPSIVFAIIPPFAASLNKKGTSMANTLLYSWLVVLGSGMGLAVLFHFFVELPSKVMGEMVAEVIEGMVDRPQGRSPAGKVMKGNNQPRLRPAPKHQHQHQQQKPVLA